MSNFKRMKMLLIAMVGGVVLLVGLAAQGPGRVTADGSAVPQRLTTITVDLEPVKDNTLYESELGTVSNGKGQFLFAGNTGNGDARRALLAFDVAGNIPASATILSATLTLNMSRSMAAESPVAIHAVAKDWGEGESDAVGEEGAGATATSGDATWLHTFFDTATWTQPGGDYNPTATATTAVSGVGSYSWQSPALVADVEGWLAAPETNFGWIVIGNESAATSAKRFDSREAANAENRPRLTITYEADVTQVFLPMAIAEE